jgi:hypothetical protein
MNVTRLLVVTVFVLALFSEHSSAQKMMGKGSGGWGANSAYCRMYDPKTVETVSGTIEKIETITPMKGMSIGKHLILKTDKETISVHLGPSWYLDAQDTQLVVGDKIEVKGSRIAYEGNPAIVAEEIKKGDEILKLRDENGFPAWAGWRRAN